MAKRMVKAVMVGLIIVGTVFMIMGWVMAENFCCNPSTYKCEDCQECPRTPCPDKDECPDCICPKCPACPDINCPEIPDCSLVCPDPCPSPCSGDVDTSGTYEMIGMGGAIGGKPNIVMGTLTIYPGDKVGIAYQCLAIGNFYNIGCAAYLLKKK